MRTAKIIRAIEDMVYWNVGHKRYETEFKNATQFNFIVDGKVLSEAAAVAPCEIITVYLTEGETQSDLPDSFIAA